jgi:hypothetical protein
MTRLIRFGSLGGLLALAVATGCTPSGVPVAQVRGKVTYKGKAVANASISFIPDARGVAPALGKTNADGEYRVTTFAVNDGAPVGTCKVAISLTGPPPPLPPHLANAPAAAETFQMPGKPLLPTKYFSVDTSGLTADVKAGTDNVFDFELTGELPK